LHFHWTTQALDITNIHNRLINACFFSRYQSGEIVLKYIDRIFI